MTDDELLDWNRRGFFPGPDESVEIFQRRVAIRNVALEGEPLPPSHWDWVRARLAQMYDFMPENLPAVYSNRKLMPWQGAVSWIEGRRIAAIQLRTALKKGHFLHLYDREEILSHEAIHAARAAFIEHRFEEFFAYATSESRWRQVLGPILQKPWEAWPFLLCCVAGPFFPLAFLGAGIWAALGFLRLAFGHATLSKAGKRLMQVIGDARKVRAILIRLSDKEIAKVARGDAVGDQSLRWRLIRLAYWKQGEV